MASHRKLHFQKVLGSMIVALALLFAGSAGAQETKTIKGMVRDVTGEPLIGASVIEKGTNNGVITDVDGNFTLTVPADATLSIAYMGYATREIHLAKRKKQGDLRVTLREDSQQLKEVVVTAMGIKKDTKRLGYAVSTIESDEIVKAGATNFASAMYGKAPGIRITQTQGRFRRSRVYQCTRTHVHHRKQPAAHHPGRRAHPQRRNGQEYRLCRIRQRRADTFQRSGGHQPRRY